MSSKATTLWSSVKTLPVMRYIDPSSWFFKKSILHWHPMPNPSVCDIPTPVQLRIRLQLCPVQCPFILAFGLTLSRFDLTCLRPALPCKKIILHPCTTLTATCNILLSSLVYGSGLTPCSPISKLSIICGLKYASRQWALRQLRPSGYVCMDILTAQIPFWLDIY